MGKNSVENMGVIVDKRKRDYKNLMDFNGSIIVVAGDLW